MGGLPMTEPANVAAEKSVIGAMLTSGPAVGRVLEGAGLTGSAYYLGRHATIHAAVEALHAKGGEVDELTVLAELEKAGTLDQAGGANYIAELAATVAAPGNAREHAELILEAHRQRQAIAIGQGILEAGQAGDLNGALDEAALALEAVRQAGGKDALKSTLAADVEMRHVKFLDAGGMIPKRSLTGLLGVAGVGKTTFTLGLAAQVTRGKLPGLDGPANVLVSSAEDDLPAVLTPRLVAAGADLQRVRFLEDLTVPDDVPALERLGRDFDAALVIVDPISAHYGPNVKGNDPISIRGALRPLATLAENLEAAVLCVVHPNKGEGQAALSRISGSAAFGDAVRSVIVFGRDPGDPEGERGVRRILASEKMNVGPKPPSIAAEIQAVEVEIDGAKASVPRLKVTGASEVKADELLAWQSPEDRSDREAAQVWLVEALADGPVASVEIKKRAEENGHSSRTLARAKADLKVKSEKTADGWQWALPGAGDDD